MKFKKILPYHKALLMIGLLFIIVLMSYGDNQPTELSAFESALPIRDLEILKEWETLYDQVVEVYYKKKGKSINDFLQDISDDNTLEWQMVSNDICSFILKFDKSTLEHRDKKLSYDTTFISSGRGHWGGLESSNKPIIVGVKKNRDTVWMDHSIVGIENIEELLEYETNRGYKESLNQSSFLEALEKIESRDSNVLNYIYDRNLVGQLSPRVLAEGAIIYDLGKNKGLIKKILIFEIFIQYIKAKNQC